MSFWLGQLRVFFFILQEDIWFAALKHIGIFTMQIPTSLNTTDFIYLFIYLISCFLFCYKLIFVVFLSEYFKYFFPGKI